MYMCVCSAITETAIDDEIKKGTNTLPELIEVMGIANVCGSCYDDLEEFVKQRLDNYENSTRTDGSDRKF